MCPNCHGHGGRTFKCYFFEGRVGRAFSASLFQGTRYLVNALGSDQSLTIHWHFMAHYSISYIYPTSLTTWSRHRSRRSLDSHAISQDSRRALSAFQSSFRSSWSSTMAVYCSCPMNSSGFLSNYGRSFVEAHRLVSFTLLDFVCHCILY